MSDSDTSTSLDGQASEAESEPPEVILGDVREVGHEGVWMLSSCKQGYAVDALRDNDPDTFWQSDGPQPHSISIQFHRRMLFAHVSLYISYANDESYTPHKVSVRIGSSLSDLKEVRVAMFGEVEGWRDLSLLVDDEPYAGFVIQIAVLTNHQNGRDTHMRGVKVFSPRLPQRTPLSSEYLAGFVTTEMTQFEHLR
eukprot:TRINITY_DN2966_c0_g1_i1.p1 TRINITY_DN2966_c0_g1~~TRINITY_DN2966_c0_g1_i1.p1  ORF type:complete len:196 (+),score=39.85 TRINITY_DN2966_c0_g1_i1:146-733(+)